MIYQELNFLIVFCITYIYVYVFIRKTNWTLHLLIAIKKDNKTIYMTKRDMFPGG